MTNTGTLWSSTRILQARAAVKDEVNEQFYVDPRQVFHQLKRPDANPTDETQRAKSSCAEPPRVQRCSKCNRILRCSLLRGQRKPELGVCCSISVHLPEADTAPFLEDGLVGYGWTFGQESCEQSQYRRDFREMVSAWPGAGAETTSRLVVEAERVEGT